MTTHAQSIANARAESSAQSYRSLQLDAQSRASAVLLSHGPDDYAELRSLAALCDVPANVLAFDLGGVR